jgi:hypothetical protein
MILRWRNAPPSACARTEAKGHLRAACEEASKGYPRNSGVTAPHNLTDGEYDGDTT